MTVCWKPLSAVALAMTLGACAAVPLRTMWQMSRMGPEAILETDPAEIRAAVMSDQLFMESEPMSELRLAVSLHTEDEADREFQFRLVEHTEAELHRLRRPSDGQAWRVFAIDREEFGSFVRMQNQLGAFLEDDQPRQLELGVHLGPEAAIVDEEEASSKQVQESGDEAGPELRAAMRRWAEDGIPVSIDLQLSAERGYLTLIRNARIPFTFSDGNEDIASN